MGLLSQSSNKLLEQEVIKWESKKVKLEQQNKNFLSKLKELLPGETFMEERERFQAYKLIVKIVENKQKLENIRRDTNHHTG